MVFLPRLRPPGEASGFNSVPELENDVTHPGSVPPAAVVETDLCAVQPGTYGHLVGRATRDQHVLTLLEGQSYLALTLRALLFDLLAHLISFLIIFSTSSRVMV